MKSRKNHIQKKLFPGSEQKNIDPRNKLNDLTSTEFLIKGGQGVISVSANIVPERIAKIFTLVMQGSVKDARKYDSELRSLHEDLFIESSPIPVKWTLNKLGRIPLGIRLPLTPLSLEYHGKIEKTLRKLGLIE